MSDNHTPDKTGIGFTEIFIGFIVIGLLSSMFLGSSKSSNSSNDASNTGFSPQECNYLTSFGLPTNAYHQQEGEDYICIADFLEVGQADNTGNESNLDFGVEGTASQITDVYLRAIYGNKSSSAAAREKFIDASKELITRTTNHPIPNKLLQAIKKGKEYQGTIDDKKITLEINPRYNYSKGKASGYGYAHQLTIYY
ncbi:TPA: hypothetical protein MW699_003546 [Acinetobacter baumannii]|nr:hypothetical protein [Acinetobacter baumannii]HCA5039487.1 hypothetical protein [Acinetobacter baumannii]HCA5369766.1 hypothetical protein [Acinetobacter baumannii]HCT2640335.1 hypothetical protein [Acinetobacter baumannii]